MVTRSLESLENHSRGHSRRTHARTLVFVFHSDPFTCDVHHDRRHRVASSACPLRVALPSSVIDSGMNAPSAGRYLALFLATSSSARDSRISRAIECRVR